MNSRNFLRGAHLRWEGGGRVVVFLFSLLIGFGLFIWVINFVGWQEIKNAFLVFRSWKGIVILLLTFLIMFMRNWTWREVIREKNIEISFWELFKIYLAGFSIRFLAPVLTLGDEIYQSYALKKRNSISWTRGMATVVIERILEWTVNLLVIFFGVLLFLFRIGLPPKNLAIILGGGFLIFFAGLFLFYFKTLKRESILKPFIKIFNHRPSPAPRGEVGDEAKPQRPLDSEPLEIEKEIFGFFELKKKSMWKCFGHSFLRMLLTYFRTLLLIIFFRQYLPLLSVFSILGFSYLATMFPIPTALGIHEAVQVFAFNALGLGSSVAAAFTMIIRGAELIVSLIGVMFLFRSGTSIFKNEI